MRPHDWPFSQRQHINTIITARFFVKEKKLKVKERSLKKILLDQLGTVSQLMLLMHRHMFEILTKEQLSLTSRTLHTH